MLHVHLPRVNWDVNRAKRSDGCGGSVENNETHIDIAVVFEGGGDRQAGGKLPAELVIRTFTCLSTFFASSFINFFLSKSSPPTYPLSVML